MGNNLPKVSSDDEKSEDIEQPQPQIQPKNNSLVGVNVSGKRFQVQTSLFKRHPGSRLKKIIGKKRKR